MFSEEEWIESKADTLAPSENPSTATEWVRSSSPRAQSTQSAPSSLASSHSKVLLSWYMGALCMTGLTTYGSSKLYGTLKQGETIFLSAAMGAMGHLVGQMVKRQGLRIVGSAGSDEEGQDAPREIQVRCRLNYKSGNPIIESFREACSEGLTSTMTMLEANTARLH
ncbi:hypothetical protein KI688_010195 [Linnemannia hyalina]|uniref:Uncharacterized protein n=1 Tax=Linnemannia hyalina TaxID=64524 RepID=A0A9P8BVL9_9FUNG|nr:hypothetical protein KI688_010195 [Linnemannia hyalina]